MMDTVNGIHYTRPSLNSIKKHAYRVAAEYLREHTQAIAAQVAGYSEDSVDGVLFVASLEEIASDLMQRGYFGEQTGEQAPRPRSRKQASDLRSPKREP